MSIDVKEFQGAYRFLSNFWPVSIRGPGGLTYPSVEHAYQASKCANPAERTAFTFHITAGQAKRLGARVKCRSDWNEDTKIRVMRDLLRQKFASGTDLAKDLAVIDGTIFEGNSWGDTFWGMCNGNGSNHLGCLLMQIRDENRANRYKDDRA